MSALDDTDTRILSLLAEDSRRPYSDIAERVDLSAPAVSDRITRLQEAGVIRRFTVDIDRSQLRSGVPVLVELAIRPDALEAVRSSIRGNEAVEHVFTTVGSDLVFSAHLDPTAVREEVLDLADSDYIRNYDVQLLSEAEWVPSIDGTEFALTCAECGNTVTSEGTTTQLGGTTYHFCCPSCETRFTDTYEELEARAANE
jgi:Lrp/AsnC family leucine-responsive transcriptional regulator